MSELTRRIIFARDRRAGQRRGRVFRATGRSRSFSRFSRHSAPGSSFGWRATTGRCRSSPSGSRSPRLCRSRARAATRRLHAVAHGDRRDDPRAVREQHLAARRRRASRCRRSRSRSFGVLYTGAAQLTSTRCATTTTPSAQRPARRWCCLPIAPHLGDGHRRVCVRADVRQDASSFPR